MPLRLVGDVRGLATGWLAEFIDDAPDRARLEAALTHRLCPVLGEAPLLEVRDADRDELERRLVDVGGGGDDRATRECLRLVLEDAIADLRAGVLAGFSCRSGGAGRATRLQE